MLRLRCGATVLAYKQEEYLSYCLRWLAPQVERVVVLFSEEPWTAYNARAKSIFTTPDRTRAILEMLGKDLPNLTVIEGIWTSEEEARNEGLQELRRSGIDVCLLVDADEFYPEGGMQKLCAEIERWNTPGTSYFVRYLTCFKRFDRVVETRYPQEDGRRGPHRVRAAVHADSSTAFVEGRNTSGAKRQLHESLYFWHMGYVLSDDRMWEKIHTWAHARELIPTWYEERWLRWTPETRNLFYKQPASRWPRTRKISAQSLPKILHHHPYFRMSPTSISPGPGSGTSRGYVTNQPSSLELRNSAPRPGEGRHA